MTIQHLDKSKRLEILAKAIFELKKDKSDVSRAVKKIENEIEECEQAGAMAPKGRLSSLIILKNKINEVR